VSWVRAAPIGLLLALPALAAEPEPLFYAQLDLNTYAGTGVFTQEVYVEHGIGGGVSLWANPYHEPGYASATLGLAKTAGHWTFALGAGQSRSDGARAGILVPWLGYFTDKTELVLSVERYDNGQPAFWQGHAQHRVGRHFLGVYGETAFGIGPAATFVVNDRLRLRVAVPVAARGDAKAMATLILVP